MSILAISNHNSFQELFDKIASVYFFQNYIHILALEMAIPGNQHCANCVGTLSFPISTAYILSSGVTTVLGAGGRSSEVRPTPIFSEGRREPKSKM